MSSVVGHHCFWLAVLWLIAGLQPDGIVADDEGKPQPDPDQEQSKILWHRCIMSGSMISTVDGKVLKCFQSCNITLLKNDAETLVVEVLKLCCDKTCNRSLILRLCHGKFKGANYIVTLRPDLTVIVVSKGVGRWCYRPDRAILIAEKFPFIVRCTGDTMVFVVPALGLRVIWDTYMDARIEFQPVRTGPMRGACNVAGGMGPKCKLPGNRTPTLLEHVKSWRSGLCNDLRCSRESEITAWRICEIVKQQPFSKCNHVMDTCNYPARCKDMVCYCLESGQDEHMCKCQALLKYIKECLIQKPGLVSLLKDGLSCCKCLPVCPPGKVFHYCYKRPCERKCETIDIEDCSEVAHVCISGCRCPEEMVDKAGICVVRNKCRNRICFGANDGTFRTFDDQHFNYKHSYTELVVRDKNCDMQIFVKYTACTGKKRRYCGLELTIKAVSSRVFIIQKSTYFLGQTIVTADGKRLKLPYKDSVVRVIPIIDGVQLLVKEIHLLVTVVSDPIRKDVFHYVIRVPSVLYDKDVNPLEGLCGGFGEASEHGDQPRLITRDSVVTSSIQIYIQSWLAYHISEEYAHEKTEKCIINLCTPCTVLDRQERAICKKIFELKNTVFKNCIKDPHPYLHECEELICLEKTVWNKKALACRIWHEYAVECCEQRHELGDWRSMAGCPAVVCPKGKCYRACGPGCDITCTQPQCPECVEWKEGCYCPPGTVHGSNGCIKPAQCQICSGHAVGEVWKDFQSCEKCRCQASGEVLCQRMCSTAPPRCSWDAELTGTKESGGCCFTCVCRRPCPPPLIERPCVRGEILRTRLTHCGCEVKYCYCHPLMCKPKPTCNQYQKLSSYKLKNDCCVYHKCECIGASSCLTLLKPRCTDEQEVVQKYDEGRCCVISYSCVCLACLTIVQRPRCRSDQKCVKVITPCGCCIYKCVCKRCPPAPVCSKYTVLKKYKQKKHCCYKCSCECRPERCPDINPNIAKCKDDQLITSIFDRSHCCVIRYCCKCPDRCKIPNKIRCPSDRICVRVKTFCGCIRYKCVCNMALCGPKPKCGKYQILRAVILKIFPRPCCKKYICVCVPAKKCPQIPPPRCTGEKIPADITDRHKCCVVRKDCVCPDICKIIPDPICKKYETLVTKMTPCNCRYRCCVCDKSRCPPCHCGKYQKLVTIKTQHCCNKRYCVCDYDQCIKIIQDLTRCRDEEKLVPIFDPNKCCVIRYACKCCECPHPKIIICRPDQKVVKTLSKCHCIRYHCECDHNKCKPPPRCGPYSVLLSCFKNSKDCCKTHKCTCDIKLCPSLVKRGCPKGKIAKPVFDPTKCCIISYRCVCLPCTTPDRKVCQPGERMRTEKDECGCFHPVCLCNGKTICAKKPICSRYQYLKITSDPKDCCMIYTCVCKGLSHCPPIRNPKCGRDEKLKDVYDPHDCCIVKRRCVCCKCKPSIQVVCKKYERLVNYPSKCCDHYRCTCDSSLCPTKHCPPHHKLNVFKIKHKCCPEQTCECLPKSCPDPKQTKPICRDEEQYCLQYDSHGCCPHHVCKCPKNPCSNRKVICGLFEKKVCRITVCHCTICHCECDVSKCVQPKPCGKYRKLVKTEQPGKCCPKYICICYRPRCPTEPKPRKCLKEEWLKPVYDVHKCCLLAYACVCRRPCPRWKVPKCKPFQVLKFLKTKCGCDKPVCVCNPKLKCLLSPQCSKYQELVESPLSNFCCRRYVCKCRGTSFCPVVHIPNCQDEEIIVSVFDIGHCCCIRKKCKCPKHCTVFRPPKCQEGEVVEPVKTRCCLIYRCKCDKSLCPPCTCGEYERKIVIPVRGKCCDKVKCVCDKRKCPQKVLKPICKGDQILTPRRDITECCIISYACKCGVCPLHHVRKCRKDQVMYMAYTVCGCKIPKCKCDYSLCPPKKVCEKYLSLKTTKRWGCCCSIYHCVCDRKLCPSTKPSLVCKDEQVLIPIYDAHYCCIISWKCECQPCHHHPAPPCKPTDICVYYTSHCGCQIPECTCVSHVCPPKPICDKYERLVAYRSNITCCVGYRCVCISITDCPVIPTPVCISDEIVVEVNSKCCPKEKKCECPKTCPALDCTKKNCGPHKKAIAKYNKCCKECICVCDVPQCVVLTCPPAHVLWQTNIPGHCCPKYRCVCKPNLCPPIKRHNIVCKGDEVLVSVKDAAGCCITCVCQCHKCPIPLPVVCAKGKKKVQKKTICGCIRYECICDNEICHKPPKCCLLAYLKTIHEVGDCCPTYICICKTSIDHWLGCRQHLKKPKCRDEQILTPVYIKHLCCIKKWICVCGECPVCKPPTCEKDQKLIIVKSACQCDRALCVCKDKSMCPVKPYCHKYQNLVVLKTSTDCCVRYACVCKGISQCPHVPVPHCLDEEVVQEITDDDDCCCVRRICACPHTCQPMPMPHCKPHDRLVTVGTKCCKRYRCDCDISRCRRKVCGGCMVLRSTHSKGLCCPHDICVCNHRCCRPCPPPRCSRGQKPIAVYDEYHCCIIRYKCICCPCKVRPKPVCGPYFKLVLKISACKCRWYVCVCVIKLCPPRIVCSQYSTVEVINVQGLCCPRCKCICSKALCPHIQPTILCLDEQVVKPILDPSNCCVIKYICICQKCRFRVSPACGQNEIVVKKKSKCGCITYECKCHDNKCPPIPECSPYEVLRTYNTTSCCHTHVCECKGLQFCPKLPPVKCKDEEKRVTRTDDHGCCIIEIRCECPEICHTPVEPKCKPFEKVTSVPTKCCNKLCCGCDIAQCPPPPICRPFEKLIQKIVHGRCCPVCSCVPVHGCVTVDRVTGKSVLRRENEKWMEGLCLQCTCCKYLHYYEVQCRHKSCPKCSLGFVLQNIPGVCCGICVQTHCICETNSLLIYELGHRWSDNCCIYICTRKNREFLIEIMRKDCRPVPFCRDNEIPREDECKCPTCKYEECSKPVTIDPKFTIGLVRVVLKKNVICRNLVKIYGLTRCVGTCRPVTGTQSGSFIETKNTYCRCKNVKILRVKLACTNGKEWLKLIKVPVSCTCKEACDCDELRK